MKELQEEYDFVTIEEMCQLIGISRSTAYKILKSPDFKATKISYGWKIPRSSIKEYLDRKLSEKK